MRFVSNLFICDKLEKKQKRTIWKIKHNVYMADVYLIALASNSENLLEVIHTVYLHQKSYPSKELVIVGLAKGYNEALELTKQIIDEVYTKTKGFDVATFFRNK